MNDHMNIPNHIAIVPDGNRRWARDRGLEPWKGHEAGAGNTEAIIREARRLGIREISFWGSSLENLAKRPVLETKALLRIYTEYFGKILEDEDIVLEEVRIRFIGHWKEQFPASLRKLLERIEEKTKHHGRHFLNFFLAYSGVDDMLGAVQGIVREGVASDKVDEATIKSHLMTAELPPVDLLIRTGGDAHLSAGFLMWDVSDAQLFFSDLLYPDFAPESFSEAISEYGRRERRFGK